MRAFWDVVATLALPAGLLLGQPASAMGQDNATCLMCHSSPAMFKGRPDADQMVVNPDSFAASIHGQMGFSCVMCHQDLTGTAIPHASRVAPVNCAACHGTVQRAFSESVHGYAAARGNKLAPTCSSCHGTHDIRPSSDPESRTNRVRLPETCAQCHGKAGVLTTQAVRFPDMVSTYSKSVHGRRLELGDTAAATCSDCHGVHDLKGPNDPSSSINPANVAGTCGKCHSDIADQYESSIHGKAMAAGLADTPTCTDCHGEHLILSPENPASSTCSAKQAQETCGPCHDNPVIIEKYGLPNVVGSYVDSYHGWAVERGCEKAATCTTCHTAHHVLPASDSASTVSPAHVVGTCQQCHKDADRRFAESYDHRAASITTNPISRAIRNIYIVVIILVIGGMALHNLLIMNYFVVERRREQERVSTVRRLDRSQIVQHVLLAVSFSILVITGFALRFPDAWWVQGLAGAGLTESLRRTVHRSAAVVLVATSLFHLYYIVKDKRGRREFLSIIPQWQDLKDLFDTVRFYTWRSKEHVEYGRYDYAEKAEYWALIWGTALMAATGFVLWFPTLAVKFLPVWSVTASQTIHYYEAWLATLAILVWHFFFVIFHPEVYPMSWTWLTGKMTTDDIKEHRGRWYEEIEKEEG